MTPTQDRESVYNDYLWKPAPQAPAPAAKSKLSPRAKAGVGAGGVILAATGMLAWSQYETAQTNAEVKKAQISLQQDQLNAQIEQQQAQAAKAAGQETPAQAARREAMEKCVAAAGSSYNGVADCAKAYPPVDPAGVVSDTQTAASSTPTGGSNSPVGLVVLGATGAVVAVGWVKKRLAR